MDFSREFGLAANVIEKDYVLGWVLAGISNHNETGSEEKHENNLWNFVPNGIGCLDDNDGDCYCWM